MRVSQSVHVRATDLVLRHLQGGSLRPAPKLTESVVDEASRLCKTNWFGEIGWNELLRGAHDSNVVGLSFRVVLFWIFPLLTNALITKIDNKINV